MSSVKEWTRPGSRIFLEVRDGDLYDIWETAHTAQSLLMSEYFRIARIAHDEGLPSPPRPDMVETKDKNEQIVCIERTERKLDARFYTRSGMRLADSQIGQGLSLAEELAMGETNQ